MPCVPRKYSNSAKTRFFFWGGGGEHGYSDLLFCYVPFAEQLVFKGRSWEGNGWVCPSHRVCNIKVCGCSESAHLSVWGGKFDLSCGWPPAACGLCIEWTISVNVECLLFCLRVMPFNIFWCVTCICHMKIVVSTSLQRNGPKTNSIASTSTSTFTSLSAAWL